MPKNKYFRRKITKLGGEIQFDSDSEIESQNGSGDEMPSDSVPRCSSPAYEVTSPMFPNLVDTYQSSVLMDDCGSASCNTVRDAEFIDDEMSDEAVDAILSESSDSDFSDVGEADGGDADDPLSFESPLWQKIMNNESCKLSVENVIALLVAIQSIFKLPDVAMDAFYKVLLICLPEGHIAPSSYSVAIKRLLSKQDSMDHTISYVCSGFLKRDKKRRKSEKLPCNTPLNKLFDHCSNPRCRLFNKKQQASGFLHLPIRPQIERTVRAHFPTIMHYLSTACTISDQECGDIPTTPAYRKLGPNPNGSTLAISLILSSDGAVAFTQGRSSFWPCVAILAELPSTIRVAAENAIGLGFWVGREAQSKPNWDRFLPSIVAELDILNRGFEMIIDGRVLRIIVRIFAMVYDLPALAAILGIKQFNGKFGCFRCLHPGVSLPENPRLRLWPQLDEKPSEKDAEFYCKAWKHLRTAVPGDDYFGVTKITPLSRICNPADVNVFDSMHMIYRGNGQLIMNRFLNSDPKWGKALLSSSTDELDSVIQNIRFPHRFNRRIPSLKSLAGFKASEIKNLLLYAIVPITVPFLQNLPDMWHWVAVYVHAIRLLSKSIISFDDADCAQKLLDAWQSLIQKFCSTSSMNFNSHGVLHLPDQSRQYGPISNISTFAFESFNGYFARYIKASKGVLMQLGRRFVLHQSALSYLSEQAQKQHQPITSVIKALFPSTYQRWTPTNDEERYRLVKPSRECKDLQTLWQLRGKFPDNATADFLFSKRAAAGSEVLHSTWYSSKTASMIKYVDEENELGASYGEAEMFMSVGGSTYMVLKRYNVIKPTTILEVPPPEDEILFSLYSERIYGSFFYIVKKTDEVSAVPLSDFISCAVLIDVGGSFVVTDLLPFEHD